MARPGAVSSSLPAIEEPPVQESDDVQLYDPPADELQPDETEHAELDAVARELGYGSYEEMEVYGRRQGWRPLAEYNGPPGTWKELPQFVSDGQNFLPFVKKDNQVLREQLTRSEKEIRNLQQQMGAMSEDMRKLLEFSRNADKAGYDRARAELVAQQRQAVIEGDVATFDEATDKLNQMADARGDQDNNPPPPPAPRVENRRPQPQGTPNPEVEAWVEANKSWFLADPQLNLAMQAADIDAKQRMPGASVTEQLNAAKETVMAQYPEKFGRRRNQAPPPPPADEDLPPPPADPSQGFRRNAGQQQPQLRRQVPRRQQQDDGLTIASIQDPRQRREADQGFRRAKLAMPDLTEQEYVKIYVDPHADVLATIDEAKGK